MWKISCRGKRYYLYTDSAQWQTNIRRYLYIGICIGISIQKVSGHIHITVPAVAGHGTRRILYIMKRTTPVGTYTYIQVHNMYANEKRCLPNYLRWTMFETSTKTRIYQPLYILVGIYALRQNCSCSNSKSILFFPKTKQFIFRK